MKMKTSEWQPVYLSGSQSFELYSKHTGESYRVLVRVPNYPAPESGYPVLWMLDAERSFPLTYSRPTRNFTAGSPVDGAETADGLIIAIGFPGGPLRNPAARARNYTPIPDGETDDRVSDEFGNASDFLSFIVEELRPLLAAKFPFDLTRQTLFGHSYGGLFAIHVLLNHPGHFQRYWAASPSLWFSETMMLRRLRALPPITSCEKLVITVGQDEQYASQPLNDQRQAHLDRRAMVDNITEAAQRIAEANPDLEMQLIIAKDHDHFDMLMHGVRRVQLLAFS
jgi:predicted alpha/beta superfamily hydrolase